MKKEGNLDKEILHILIQFKSKIMFFYLIALRAITERQLRDEQSVIDILIALTEACTSLLILMNHNWYAKLVKLFVVKLIRTMY